MGPGHLLPPQRGGRFSLGRPHTCPLLPGLLGSPTHLTKFWLASLPASSGKCSLEDLQVRELPGWPETAEVVWKGVSVQRTEEPWREAQAQGHAANSLIPVPRGVWITEVFHFCACVMLVYVLNKMLRWVLLLNKSCFSQLQLWGIQIVFTFGRLGKVCRRTFQSSIILPLRITTADIAVCSLPAFSSCIPVQTHSDTYVHWGEWEGRDVCVCTVLISAPVSLTETTDTQNCRCTWYFRAFKGNSLTVWMHRDRRSTEVFHSDPATYGERQPVSDYKDPSLHHESLEPVSHPKSTLNLGKITST